MLVSAAVLLTVIGNRLFTFFFSQNSEVVVDESLKSPIDIKINLYKFIFNDVYFCHLSVSLNRIPL